MCHHCSYFRHCCNYATIENTVFLEISEVSKRKSWLVKNKYIINKIKVKRDSKNQSTFSTEPKFLRNMSKKLFNWQLGYEGKSKAYI